METNPGHIQQLGFTERLVVLRLTHGHSAIQPASENSDQALGRLVQLSRSPANASGLEEELHFHARQVNDVMVP